MLHVSLLGEQAITDDADRRRPDPVVARRSPSSRTWPPTPGRPQARQRIAGLFWPDSTDAQALTNLRRELHHLRQVLGDEPSLVVTARDLCWRDTETCRVDLRTFDVERRGRAGRGGGRRRRRRSSPTRPRPSPSTAATCCPACTTTGCSTPGRSSSASAWTCATCSARRGRAAGDLAGAVDAARRRIQLQPLEEAGYRTLMRLQADLGDRAGALSTYHHCASVLERELGVVPDPATRQMFQRLMAHADRRRTPPAAEPGRPARPGSPPRSSSAGRGELGLLQDMWQAAAAGRPGLALVRGGAGVGKTRLVTELAAAGTAAGRGRGEQPVLRHVGAAGAGPGGGLAAQPGGPGGGGDAGPGLARRGRAAGARRRARGAPGPATAGDGRRLAAAPLLRGPGPGAARASGRPTLLVLDNMQWCDQETLAFLTFCLGLAPAPRSWWPGRCATTASTTRPELADWAVRMRATGLLTELSLGPLEAADTARLAEAISGRPLLDGRRGPAAGGHRRLPAVRHRGDAQRRRPGSAPLPAGDLAAVLRQPARPGDRGGPGGGRPGRGGRARTSPSTCSPRPATSTPTPWSSAVDELWRRRIVRELGDGYDFSHDLLRDDGVRAGQPAAAVAAAPAPGPGPGAAARRRHRTRWRRSSPSSTPAAGSPTGPSPTTGAPPRSRRAVFAHAEAIRLHQRGAGDPRAACPRGATGTARSSPSWRPWPPRSTPGTATPHPELQQTLERSIALAESLGRKDSMLTGLVALWASQFVQGRDRRRLPDRRPGRWPSPSPAPS